MKVIFLDFDGVLNWHGFLSGIRPVNGSGELDYAAMLDPSRVALLNQICEQTGAVVVVSSTWRRMHRNANLRGFLKSRGFAGKMIGSTPKLERTSPERVLSEEISVQRGEEIAAWINERPGDISRFVILDDDSDMAHLSRFLVQTSMETGLQPDHVTQAVAILEGK